MAQKPIIVLGDTSSHGGMVSKTQQTERTINDMPIATVGDEFDCPIPGHGKNKIVKGSSLMTIDGKAVAYDGCQTACGAVLKAGLQTFVSVEVEGGGAASASASDNSTVTTPNNAKPEIDDTAMAATATAAEIGEAPPPPEEIVLRVLVAFDGTSNNAGNTTQRENNCPDLDDAHSFEQHELLIKNCEAKGIDVEGSYGNDFSNVYRLWDLYPERRTLAESPLSNQPANLLSRRVYVEGIGTQSGEKDNTFSMATGRGERGVIAKVRKGLDDLTTEIRNILSYNPNTVIRYIEVDVTGFSRGAAAARHFINVVSGQVPSEWDAKTELAKFGPKLRDTRVRIKTAALFDTVPAIASAEDGYDASDNHNEGLHLDIAGLCEKAVHLVAGHEWRKNFSLCRINTGGGHEEHTLPGAHSDIGGGYLAVDWEDIPIGDWHMAFYRGEPHPFHNNKAVQDCQREAQAIIDQGWTESRTGLVIEQYIINDKNGGPRRMRARLRLRRQVRGDYSRLPLKLMHEKLVAFGVPLEPYPLDTPLHGIAPELLDVLDELRQQVNSATGLRRVFGKGAKGLSEEKLKWLMCHYLHHSAHDGGFLSPHAPRKHQQRYEYEPS